MDTPNLLEVSDPTRSSEDPEPEVPAKANRRRYTAAYNKKRILEEADRC